MRCRRCGHLDLVCYGYIVVLVFLWWSIVEVRGSIHEYENEAFIPRFNSFFFHGGRDGLYASKVHDSSNTSEEKPLNGKSFIRYANLEDGIEEDISLTGGGVKVAGVDMETKLERKERNASIAANLVFGLGDDLEEECIIACITHKPYL